MPSFVGLTEMHDFLGIAYTNTRHDTILNSLIDQVSSLFEAETGRTFDATDHTQYFDTIKDQDKLVLDEFPVISAAGLSLAEDLSDTIDSTEYFTDTETIIEGTYSWPSRACRNNRRFFTHRRL